MNEFVVARRNMVLSQVRPDDVTDKRISNAMLDTPREKFIPAARRAAAYASDNVEIAPGRCLLAPRTFAKLAQMAEIAPDDLVLVIGCASGYSAAILSHLADTVVSLECDETLSNMQSDLLLELGVDNAAVVTGSLQDGYPEQGPYNVIFVCGVVAELPDSLANQLKNGGRLVGIFDDGGVGRAKIYRKTGHGIGCLTQFDAAAPVLPGFEPVSGFVF
jgi:protein-L-isoaspartate(D-aspartate) O-methyltransferase